MGGELVEGSIFYEEARSCGLLQVVVRCSDRFRCNVNLHQEDAENVVRADGDPQMALLERSRPLLAPEASEV
jgi:hypothetical protein